MITKTAKAAKARHARVVFAEERSNSAKARHARAVLAAARSNSAKARHASTVLAAAISGAGSASVDTLCKARFSYPAAIELAYQIHAGVGNAEELRSLGFTGHDAEAIAANITAAGAYQ